MTVTVVVADDNAPVRSSLCAVFADDERFRVVGQAVDAEGAVATVARERPDVVVLDVRMPGGGVAAARGIAGLGLPATMITVSARLDPLVVENLLRAGVRGMFLKGRLGTDLADLVLRCRAGEVLLATPGAAHGLRALLDGAPAAARGVAAEVPQV